MVWYERDQCLVRQQWSIGLERNVSLVRRQWAIRLERHLIVVWDQRVVRNLFLERIFRLLRDQLVLWVIRVLRSWRGDLGDGLDYRRYVDDDRYGDLGVRRGITDTCRDRRKED